MSDSLCHTSVRSYAVCGMGGIGKTQIAVEYAYTRHSKYDAIFFVTADSKTKLSEEFADIAFGLGLEDQIEVKDLTVSCEIVKGWLSNPVRSYNSPPSASNEASWLLIFDNADDIDVLEDCWPTTGIGFVLITSRDSFAKNQIYMANHGIDLKPLSTHDAVEFLNILTRRFPRLDQEQNAAEVVNKLGGLPLLITQMAGVMTRLRLSYSEFLALYKASGIEDMSLTRDMTSTEEQVHSISSKIGLDGLATKSLGLLCLISLLDPDRIPEGILINACAYASFEYFPRDLVQYYESRAQLLQTSLINQNPETKDVSVHRLVQDVAREKFEHKQLIAMYNLAIKAVSSIWPFATLETRFTTARYKSCAPVFPSLVSLSKTYELVSTLESFRPELASATLFGDAGWYRFERGFQEESKEWFKTVEGICDGLEDKSSVEVAYMIRDTHHNLGTAAGETNDTKSFLKHTSIWLEMLKQRKTPEGESVIDYELCMGYNETGVAHAMDAQYQVAITYFSKAIESFQALPHYEDTMQGWSASNIGLVYWILGDYVQAEQALLEIIEIFKNANGVDDVLSFKTGKMLYALGNVYVSQGRFTEGFEYHTRCLKQYRATLGDSHHRIGDICHRLADDNLRFKNHAEARHPLLSNVLQLKSIAKAPLPRVLINQALKSSVGVNNTSKSLLGLPIKPHGFL
ncbi:tetratricopeptide repeat domain-containing protein [Penicillium verhagenii]|uniref:tetratricopeptide repeat domain-containing protein n=1 Tax=Penicillium verhagenii TaxID=1562060 RepID=UPI0025453AB7|nr:tetratricopeptide repeat domain-containing protein [Penicillium verhagenii]KAJ5921327.1 tetratricopeptide repeat domain-containing protein [Penicillium verhagenii]